ncbi:MAG: hypothetical protein KGJ98_08665 [Chloroflexota bacterium]|nr:hypothetical protein [Chloroflexota bacterium]
MLTPFGAAFGLVGPASGFLSDRLGSRGLSTVGPLVSAAGFLGLATIVADTPYWEIEMQECTDPRQVGTFFGRDAQWR